MRSRLGWAFFLICLLGVINALGCTYEEVSRETTGSLSCVQDGFIFLDGEMYIRADVNAAALKYLNGDYYLCKYSEAQQADSYCRVSLTETSSVGN